MLDAGALDREQKYIEEARHTGRWDYVRSDTLGLVTTHQRGGQDWKLDLAASLRVQSPEPVLARVVREGMFLDIHNHQ